MRSPVLLLILLCGLSIAACYNTAIGPDSDVESDGDADADSDGDGDGDADPPPNIGGGDAPETLIPRAKISPTIDGVLREWPPLRYSLHKNNAEHRVGSDQQPEATDASLQFDLRWTDDALIFAARMLDDAAQSDSDLIWQDDSIELYVDGDNNDDVPTYDDNDHQFTVARDSRITDKGLPFDNEARNVVFGVDETGPSYTLELAVPWSDLGGPPPAGHVFGIDVAFNDDDDGEGEDTHLVKWLDHELTELGSPVQDTSLFHDLTLGL